MMADAQLAAKFKAVAGKGERRGAVTVGVVDHKFGNLRDIELHSFFALQYEEVGLVAVLDMLEQIAQMLAEKG